MTRHLTVRVDPAAVSMARAIRVAAAGAPMLVITGRAFSDLAAELGGADAAAGHLLELAQQTGRPIGVNFATSEDTSSTVFLPPPGWTEERLAGWVAGHHQDLEAEFGAATRVGAGSAP